MSLRILHAVEFYAPSVGGAQEVVRQVSERLAARGHQVTVATTRLPGRRFRRSRGVDVAEFDIRGNAVRGMTGEVGAYQRFVQDGAFDVVMTYAAQQWTTDALLPVLEGVTGARILAPCGFSALRRPEYSAYFDRLRVDLHRFDALIFHSGTYQDFRFAQDAGVATGVVIPNAADEREFAELNGVGLFRAAHRLRNDVPLLLTVGGHTGLKGHAQTMSAFRRTRRARGGALAIIGNAPTGRGCRTTCAVRGQLTRLVHPGRRVIFDNPPRPMVLAAYADADLFVFCSMIECSPLVLFEAIAAGLPFVSVDVGNAAEIAAWSGAGVIVPSRRTAEGLVEAETGDVAAAIDELLADARTRRSLATRGRRAWAEHFTWEAATTRYEQLYGRVVRSEA